MPIGGADGELRLWRVGRALTLALAAAVLVAVGIFYGLVVPGSVGPR
ncbi:hypothetical protein [Streptomyces sanglieri]